jgi:membrane protein DedA with SNARE-associated domain
MHIAGLDITQLLITYGYLAILVIVGLESAGVPLPGETILIAASIYAGTTHNLNIVLIIGAAVTGAVVGDNLGYWAGRTFGLGLLQRFGPKIGLGESRLRLGQFLFHRHGGKIVFFGRFVAILRTLAALLAGVNAMRWPRFVMFNLAGGFLWATSVGASAYLFGAVVGQVSGPVSVGLLLLAVVGIGIGFVYLRRTEKRLLEESERAAAEALPGKTGATLTNR